jgi:polyphosphate kinase
VLDQHRGADPARCGQALPGFRIHGHGTFRVLRDSDIEIEEDAEDLVRYFRTPAIQRRRRGKVILLQVQENFDPAAEALLRDEAAAGLRDGDQGWRPALR